MLAVEGVVAVVEEVDYCSPDCDSEFLSGYCFVAVVAGDGGGELFHEFTAVACEDWVFADVCRDFVDFVCFLRCEVFHCLVC